MSRDKRRPTVWLRSVCGRLIGWFRRRLRRSSGPPVWSAFDEAREREAFRAEVAAFRSEIALHRSDPCSATRSAIAKALELRGFDGERLAFRETLATIQRGDPLPVSDSDPEWFAPFMADIQARVAAGETDIVIDFAEWQVEWEEREVARYEREVELEEAAARQAEEAARLRVGEEVGEHIRLLRRARRRTKVNRPTSFSARPHVALRVAALLLVSLAIGIRYCVMESSPTAMPPANVAWKVASADPIRELPYGAIIPIEEIAAPQELIARAAQIVSDPPLSLWADMDSIATSRIRDILRRDRTKPKSLLFAIANGPPKLREALVGVFVLGLQDPDPGVQMAAVYGIWKVAPNDPGLDAAARHLARTGSTATNNAVRSMSLNIIRQRPTEDNLAFMIDIVNHPRGKSDDEIRWALMMLNDHPRRAPIEATAALFHHRAPMVDARAAGLLYTIGDPRGRARLVDICRGGISNFYASWAARSHALQRLLGARDPEAVEIAMEWLNDPNRTDMEWSTASRAMVELGEPLTRHDVRFLLEEEYAPDRIGVLSDLAAAGDVLAPAELFAIFDHVQSEGEWTRLIRNIQQSTGGEFRAQIMAKILNRKWDRPHALARVKQAYNEAFGETTWPTQP